MENKTIVLTPENIEAFRTDKGAFTRHQMQIFAQILGEPLQLNGWTLATGWPARLIGKEVTAARFNEILSGRSISAKQSAVICSGQLNLL